MKILKAFLIKPVFGVSKPSSERHTGSLFGLMKQSHCMNSEALAINLRSSLVNKPANTVFALTSDGGFALFGKTAKRSMLKSRIITRNGGYEK